MRIQMISPTHVVAIKPAVSPAAWQSLHTHINTQTPRSMLPPLISHCPLCWSGWVGRKVTGL